MIRVASISDSHFDERSRFEECQELHHWIANDIERRAAQDDGIALITHCGDLYERRSTPKERLALAGWLERLAAIAPVVIVRGNHDVPGDLALMEKLRTDHPIYAVEVPTRLMIPLFNSGPIGAICVAALPWPRRGVLRRAVGDCPPDQLDAQARKLLQDTLRGLQGRGEEPGRRPPGIPKLFVGHAMMSNAVASTGQPMVGFDSFEIDGGDLALVGADAYLLGHIHKPQPAGALDVPSVYVGSARRTDFGETEEKSYAIVTFEPRPTPASSSSVVNTNHDPGRWNATLERVRIPARPLLTFEAKVVHLTDRGALELQVEGQPKFPPDGSLRGAEVRLRYRVAAEDRLLGRGLAAAWEETALERAGALAVKLEPQTIPSSKARAPGIAQVASIGEKVQLMWHARGDDPSTERANRLLAMIAELEAS